jgi:Leucine-rich repeat (LRR) protein
MSDAYTMASSSSPGPQLIDGEAHLFRDEPGTISVLAISTTGCFAIKTNSGEVTIHHWFFKSKGKSPVRIDNARWVNVWACRGPNNAQRSGHITRLHCGNSSLTAVDVRSLTKLSHFRCAHNYLTQLDLSGLSALRTLDCVGNELNHLTLDGCHRLERLLVAGNPRLRVSATNLVAAARSEPSPLPAKRRLTSTSLFDL